MATPAQKTKVGAFLAFSVVLIVGGFFLISGYRTQPHTPFWIRFDESVLGLSTGSLVEYLGVPVGTVDDIFVDDMNAANVRIMVNDSRVTLREGVTAKLVLYNIAAGSMAISLEGGDGDQPALPADTYIPVESSLLSSFTGQIDLVLAEVGEVAKALNTALAGLEEGAVTQIVENVNALVLDSRDFVASTQETMDGLNNSVQRTLNEFTKLEKDARWLVEDVGAVAENANAFIKLATEKLEPLDIAKLQSDLTRIMDEMSTLAQRLNDTLAMMEDVGETVIHEAGNIEFALRESLQSATEAFDAVNDLATSLQENPSSLIRGRGNARSEE